MEHNKLELIYSTVRESITFRRGREQQIFAWSSALLVAVISALLLTEIKQDSLIATMNGRIAGTIVSALVFLGSCFWQHKQRKLLCDSQKNAARLMAEMGMFDLTAQTDGKPIVPRKWREWGSRNNTFWGQLKQPSKILFTVIIGIATIVVIWIR